MKLVNTIDEKELYAARSVADKDGNQIDITYAKVSDIPSIDGLMAESKLTIEGGKITEYDGTPFAGGSSDIVHFDYNNGNPELSWSEIKAYMDTGKQLIIYDKTVATDGKTKLGYVSNYDKVNNFIQFTNISNMVVEGETVNGINWAYVGNSLGWQRTFIRNGGSGGKTYTGVEPIIVDNEDNTISADTVDVNYQQFTHDDSLVHVSNDAQYALGVNTRMFKDETLLWEGNLNSVNDVANLSETLENFETVKFYCCDTNNNCTNVVEVSRTKNNNFGVSNFNIDVEFVLNGNGNLYKRHTCLLPNSGRTTLTATKGYELIFTTAKATNYNSISSGALQCILTKVVGVGRKGGN